MEKISKRIQNISESQTLALNSACKELESKGEIVFNFSVGEPDIAPPKMLSDEIMKALDGGCTKYTNPIGITESRVKIAQYISEISGVIYSQNEIALTSGGKQALFNIFQTILNPGDEVIIISPFWVSYVEQVRLAGGEEVLVDTDEHLQLDVKAVARAITKKTRAIILNSPCNPTGIVFEKEKIVELAKLLEEKDIYIISDDVYQTLVYEGEFYQVASYSELVKEKTIIIQSFSKSFSMTGLRLGVIAADKEIISGVAKLQGHAAGNPTSIIQAAVAEIIGKTEEYESAYHKIFKERREMVGKLLAEIEGITFVKPGGAFYYFINIANIENDSMKFATRLLNEKHVAMVPGIAFGKEGYVRMSFAASKEDLESGVALLKEFIENY